MICKKAERGNDLYIVSYIVMGIGVAFMLFGIIGIFKPGRDFYYRILVACKIDTVGILTLGIGMAIRHGFSFFTGKLFLIIIIMMILNPLVAHLVARSAYKSGYVPACDDSDTDGAEPTTAKRGSEPGFARRGGRAEPPL